MRRQSIILQPLSLSHMSASAVNAFLENIRQNAVVYSNAHKTRFAYLDSTLKWYKIPIIVLSGVSSVVSFSQSYISQYSITITNAMLGLVCSVICSVELYLGISREMSSCDSASRDYYLLAIEIEKFLKTHGGNSDMGATFLEQMFGQYSALYENSSHLKDANIIDKLIVLPTDIEAPIHPSLIERTSSVISNLVKSAKN